MSIASGKTAAKPPFLAFAGEDDIAVLQAFAAARGWEENCVRPGNIKTAAEYLKSHPSPALLLVELPSASEAPALLDALAEVCDPDTNVITTGTVNEYSFYCWLMDIGIFSYLLKPLTEEMLENAYQKSLSPVSHLRHEKPPGKVIAVLGARGGVGATTVALNLAGIVADLSKKHVALVDIDPQEGSLALSLDIEPSRGLRDALEKPDRIDSLFIERVMHKMHKQLSVLSAEEGLHDRLNIHEQAGDMLLKELRGTFDIIVLDIPRHMRVFGRQCLKQADHVVLVADLTLASLRDTLRTSDMLRESLKMKPPIIVASRTGFAPKQEVPLADFEKGVSAKIAHRIPFAPDVFMAVGSEIAAIKMKTHAAVQPLYDLTAQLVPEAKRKTVAKKKSPLGLLNKFRK